MSRIPTLKRIFLQYEFIMHFVIPVEFLMSAPSPCAVLMKCCTFTQYCNSIHCPLESFSSFSHKILPWFQAENFLGSVVPREVLQSKREFMKFMGNSFTVPSVICAN